MTDTAAAVLAVATFLAGYVGTNTVAAAIPGVAFTGQLGVLRGLMMVVLAVGVYVSVRR